MKKISTFFNAFIKSLTSPVYYADVLRAKMSFSLKYFLFLTLFLALITAVKVSVPLALFDVSATATKFANMYPQNLDVKLKNGRISINQPLPYAVPMPAEFRSTASEMNSTSRKSPTNLVVFDSDKNVKTVSDFYNYDTAALVTETTVYTADNKNNSDSVTVTPVSKNAKDFELNANLINGWKNHFLNVPFVKNKWYVPAFIAILFLLLVPLMYVFRVITAFLYAIILYFVVRVFKAQLVHGTTYTFTQMWQVSLHTLTLPIVLSYVIGFFPITPMNGMIYFLVYLIFSLFVLSTVTGPIVQTPVENEPLPEPKKPAHK